MIEKAQKFLKDLADGKVSFWPIIILAGIVWLGLSGDGAPGNEKSAVAEFIEFAVHKALFAVQMLVAIGLGLALVYATNWVRAHKWFDRHGAASEMGVIRKRINEGTGSHGDSIACAIQYAGNTLLIAAVVFGFILIQKP